MFREDLDHLNFSELAAGTPFGRLREACSAPLLVTVGDDPQNRWLGLLRDSATADPHAAALRDARDAHAQRSGVRQDCLCYLMERLSPPVGAAR